MFVVIVIITGTFVVNSSVALLDSLCKSNYMYFCIGIKTIYKMKLISARKSYQFAFLIHLLETAL